MKVSDTNCTNWHESRQKLKMERGVRLGRGTARPRVLRCQSAGDEQALPNLLI